MTTNDSDLLRPEGDAAIIVAPSMAIQQHVEPADARYEAKAKLWALSLSADRGRIEQQLAEINSGVLRRREEMFLQTITDLENEIAEIKSKSIQDRAVIANYTYATSERHFFYAQAAFCFSAGAALRFLLSPGRTDWTVIKDRMLIDGMAAINQGGLALLSVTLVVCAGFLFPAKWVIVMDKWAVSIRPQRRIRYAYVAILMAVISVVIIGFLIGQALFVSLFASLLGVSGILTKVCALKEKIVAEAKLRALEPETEIERIAQLLQAKAK